MNDKGENERMPCTGEAEEESCLLKIPLDAVCCSSGEEKLCYTMKNRSEKRKKELLNDKVVW